MGWGGKSVIWLVLPVILVIYQIGAQRFTKYRVGDALSEL